MTNLEALQSLTNLDVPNLCEKVLLDNNLTASTTYDSNTKDTIELCSAYVYKSILSHPDFGEGKLSLKIDRNSLTYLMNQIFKKNNLETEIVGGRPNIRFEGI